MCVCVFYKNNTKKSKNNIKLSRICAIQIIGEVVQSDNNNYNSYELNLVLDDSTRINVIDHGNLKGVIQDANWLSDFLNIPVWHAGSNKTSAIKRDGMIGIGEGLNASDRFAIVAGHVTDRNPRSEAINPNFEMRSFKTTDVIQRE